MTKCRRPLRRMDEQSVTSELRRPACGCPLRLPAAASFNVALAAGLPAAASPAVDEEAESAAHSHPPAAPAARTPCTAWCASSANRQLNLAGLLEPQVGSYAGLRRPARNLTAATCTGTGCSSIAAAAGRCQPSSCSTNVNVSSCGLRTGSRLSQGRTFWMRSKSASVYSRTQSSLTVAGLISKYNALSAVL